MGLVLKPTTTTVSGANNVSAAGQPATTTTAGSKVLTGDLDSSLASLAQNLTINKSAQPQVKFVFIFLFAIPDATILSLH